jgi:hypothetical protein
MCLKVVFVKAKDEKRSRGVTRDRKPYSLRQNDEFLCLLFVLFKRFLWEGLVHKALEEGKPEPVE